MPERKTSIAEAAELLTQPFTHTVLGQVDDYCAYLSRFEGTYKFHEHAKDEMYVVLEGEIFIDYDDGPSVPVRQGETSGGQGRRASPLPRRRGSPGADVQGRAPVCRVETKLVVEARCSVCGDQNPTRS